MPSSDERSRITRRNLPKDGFDGKHTDRQGGVAEPHDKPVDIFDHGVEGAIVDGRGNRVETCECNDQFAEGIHHVVETG